MAESEVKKLETTNFVFAENNSDIICAGFNLGSVLQQVQRALCDKNDHRHDYVAKCWDYIRYNNDYTMNEKKKQAIESKQWWKQAMVYIFNNDGEDAMEFNFSGF